MSCYLLKDSLEKADYGVTPLSPYMKIFRKTFALLFRQSAFAKVIKKDRRVKICVFPTADERWKRGKGIAAGAVMPLL